MLHFEIYFTTWCHRTRLMHLLLFYCTIHHTLNIINVWENQVKTNGEVVYVYTFVPETTVWCLMTWYFWILNFIVEFPFCFVWIKFSFSLPGSSNWFIIFLRSHIIHEKYTKIKKKVFIMVFGTLSRWMEQVPLICF